MTVFIIHINHKSRIFLRALELWRAAQKQVEIEQTETFDYKGNKGFEKRVKIHKTEYHEMQIQVNTSDIQGFACHNYFENSRILRQIQTLQVRKSGNKYWSNREIEMIGMQEIIRATAIMSLITSITGNIVVSSFSLLIFNLLTQQQISIVHEYNE